MLLSKKNYNLVNKVIKSWEDKGVISSQESENLKSNIEVAGFNWKKLAKYSLWISMASLIISIFSIIFDKIIIEAIINILKFPDPLNAILSGIGSAAFYYWGFKRKNTKPANFFSNEFILFVGAIFTGISVFFIGKSLDNGSGHFSLIILMASIVYMVIGSFFPSVPIWVTGLFSLSSWFGTETGYASGWGAYYLGMNYPLRFILFGALLIAVSFLMKKNRFNIISKSTYIVGLLHTFIALWILSIFGNIDTFYRGGTENLFLWSLLFGLCALGFIFYGLKTDDKIARSFGLTFLGLNLYTKFFEYFWNTIHKAVFFTIIAISFWLIGKYSEKVINKLKDKINFE